MLRAMICENHHSMLKSIVLRIGHNMLCAATRRTSTSHTAVSCDGSCTSKAEVTFTSREWETLVEF